MKSKANRLKVKRLFIVGAGASHSASITKAVKTQTPLDKDFCKKITELDVARPTWVKKSCDILKRQWQDCEESQLSLEKTIITQLSDLEFIDFAHPHRKATSITTTSYMNHLSHLMAFVLRRCKENVNFTYHTFVSKVFPSGINIENCEDRIITFNYDDLLDRHLINRFGIERVYFDGIKEKRTSPRRRILHFVFPLLLKLHGSVSWRCEENEFEKIIDSNKQSGSGMSHIEVWYSKAGCPKPDDNVSPLIIPPLPVKPISKIGLFNYLWTRAYEYLHEANELIICGYSLPEVDRLAISLFSNFVNKNLTKVTIVDPNATILDKWQRIISDKNKGHIDWVWCGDFAKYVREIL